MPFKVYGTIGYSWITDFEYWDIPPSSSILYDNPLSVENEDKLSNLVIFPIPTNRVLNFPIDNLGLEYEIFTVTGEIVKKGILENQMIDVSSLETGIYFIKYIDETNNIKHCAKFIKN
jgi:hypothetical protein